MPLPPLARQPVDTPWPTREWPRGALAEGHPAAAMLDAAFTLEGVPELGETEAVLIVQGGRLLMERYGAGPGPGGTCHSWSMAKSITHALVGLLVRDGRLDIHAPADVPEWRRAGDPRGAITLDQLLRMSSGLAFNEQYRPEAPSDVVEMLFGRGQDDVAGFAAAFPLAHAPDTAWSYASGTTNIVARCAARALGVAGPGFEAFMRSRLFEPLGMKSPVPKFDTAGTFIGSSFCFCTPRDFARFGLLYARDGIWAGERLLPEGWVDYARTKTPASGGPEGAYGAHWWLETAGPGSFSANGYDGQYIGIVPELDLIVVRNGRTPLDSKDALAAWLARLVETFR
jgi:CubicO group peptidase (beta-lactamase class C family)